MPGAKPAKAAAPPKGRPALSGREAPGSSTRPPSRSKDHVIVAAVTAGAFFLRFVILLPLLLLPPPLLLRPLALLRSSGVAQEIDPESVAIQSRRTPSEATAAAGAAASLPARLLFGPLPPVDEYGAEAAP